MTFFENQKNTRTASPFNDPSLSGPERLCIVFGSVIGDFFGAGDPITDVYSWEILGPSGQLLFEGAGGAGFQTLSYTFSLTGTHVVNLSVSRGSEIIYTESQNVEIIPGAMISLRPDYTTCSSQNLIISAIDPASSRFDEYFFEWQDESGTVISTSNDLNIVNPGDYSVTFYLEDSQGEKACERTLSTSVALADQVSILANATTTCPGEPVDFTTDLGILGDWYFQKDSDPQEVFITTSTSILLEPSFALDGPGNYEIIFRVDNAEDPNCSLEARTPLTYNPNPEFRVISSLGSTGCQVPDGSIIIEAVTALDQVTIAGSGQVSPPLLPGDTFEFTGLKSGTYTGLGTLGECIFRLATVVSLEDPPESLAFEILDLKGEECTETGKNEGSFLIRLINGAVEGGYRVINERGSIVRNGDFDGSDSYAIEISGGKYFVEVFDLDSCSLPNGEEIFVDALEQTQFFIQQQISVCQTFDYTPITSQPLEFTLTKPNGEIEVKDAGEAFTLDQAGVYEILGAIPGQNLICPQLQTFEVFLVDPIDFEPILIEQDCFGNRIYQADIKGADPDDAIFTWLDENDNIVSQGEFLIPVTNGLFKLDVQPRGSQACPIPPVEFLIEEPILSVDLSLESTQLCELGPGAIISLTSTFPEEITDIEWRRYDSDRTIEPLPQFKDQAEITVTEAGVYEASVFSRIPAIGKNCELGRETISLVVNPDLISFTVPNSLSICEEFEFTPETTQALIFQVTAPDGTVEEKPAGEPFTLDQTGDYIFYAFDPNSETLCPNIQTLNVTVNPIPIFRTVFQSKDCDGNQTFLAEVDNYGANEVLYIWRDSLGNTIENQAQFTTSSNGQFSLEVQPLNSFACDLEPVPFQVEELVLAVDVDLSIDPFCPDSPFTTLVVAAEFENVNQIQWWYTDFDENRSELINFRNQESIQVSEEGTYEVRLLNDIGCLLGSDLALVIRIANPTRPQLEESYQVCARYEIGPSINPGSFASYEWYLEDVLVSTSPIYKPINPGQYTLLVMSPEGCLYSGSFLAEEECELRVTLPNAIQPSNPNQQFLVYTNYLIDELEVSIFNQWGQLIFYCQKFDLITEEATCFWDGTFEGKAIPNGSYAVRLNFENYEQNIHQYKLGTILVIE